MKDGGEKLQRDTSILYKTLYGHLLSEMSTGNTLYEDAKLFVQVITAAEKHSIFPTFFFYTLITKKIEVENPADNYASWSGVTSAGFSDAHGGL